MTDTNARRGRPAAFANKSNLMTALVAIRDGGEAPSRFLTLQLVEMGLVQGVSAESNGKRGRPAITYSLTGQGRSRAALLARNAAKAAAKAEAEAATV